MGRILISVPGFTSRYFAKNDPNWPKMTKFSPKPRDAIEQATHGIVVILKRRSTVVQNHPQHGLIVRWRRGRESKRFLGEFFSGEQGDQKFIKDIFHLKKLVLLRGTRTMFSTTKRRVSTPQISPLGQREEDHRIISSLTTTSE